VKRVYSLAASSALIAMSGMILSTPQATASGLPDLGRCSGSSQHCVIISNRNGNTITPCIQAFDAHNNPLSINDCSKVPLNSVRRAAMPNGTANVTVSGKGATFSHYTLNASQRDRCFRYAADTFHEATDQSCTRG
jgi:hypothetical protein